MRAPFTSTPTYPIFNETVSFVASSSTPNGGIIVSYVWDFGDVAAGTSKVTNQICTMPGNYTVVLKVTNGEGRWNYTSADITVVPEFPSFFNLPLFVLATLRTVVVCRRKRFLNRHIANNQRGS